MFGVLVLIFSLISILPSIEMAVSTVCYFVLSFNFFYMDGRLCKSVLKPSGEIGHLLVILCLQVPCSTEMLEVGHLVVMGCNEFSF